MRREKQLPVLQKRMGRGRRGWERHIDGQIIEKGSKNEWKN